MFFFCLLPLLFFSCGKKGKNAKSTASQRRGPMPKSNRSAFMMREQPKYPLPPSYPLSLPETKKMEEKKQQRTTPAQKTPAKAVAADDEELKFAPPPEDTQAEDTDLVSLKGFAHPLHDQKVQDRMTRPRKPKAQTDPVMELGKEPEETDSGRPAESMNKPSSQEKSDSEEKEEEKPKAAFQTNDSIRLLLGAKDSDHLTKKQPAAAVDKRKSIKEKQGTPATAAVVSTVVPTGAPSPAPKVSERKGTKNNEDNDGSSYL